MKPLIGITSEVILNTRNGKPWNSNSLLASYVEAVQAAGGAPVILPSIGEHDAEFVLERLDGVILSGGKPDVPPEIFGEVAHPTVDPMPMERWHNERRWLNAAIDADKPVLGICLGMQVMALVAGGSIIQDIPSQFPGAGRHIDETAMFQHLVVIEQGTILAEWAPAPKVSVVSSHHQAVADPGSTFRVAAHSEDGLIEAIESTKHACVLGVQWHPERASQRPDWLLSVFVARCGALSPR